jgi:hypothetical protein
MTWPALSTTPLKPPAVRPPSAGASPLRPAMRHPHTELTEAPGLLRSAAQEAADAWRNASLVTTTTMPWGEEYTGAALVDMYLVELAAHAWDLAWATGQLDVWQPRSPGQH